MTILTSQKKNKTISTLIVDDSLTVRKTISRILHKTKDILVVGEAENGKEAIELTERFNPSVILMDIIMPVMNGLSAIEYIMSHHPTAIIVHSSSKARGEMYKTWDALKAGALARIDKELAQVDYNKWEQELLRTIRAASCVKIVQRPKRRPATNRKTPSNKLLRTYNLIAIGASTGGPGVIANMLNAFPTHFPLPILVVLHIPNDASFTFAEWLNENCKLNVIFASHGEQFINHKGKVYIAPPNQHMVVRQNRIHLEDSEPVNFCRPSVDTLFHSLAKSDQIHPIGVLLTGMGKDGAAGLLNIRDSGGYTICQDQETCIVYGMPKAAVDLDAADCILPNYRISEKIFSLLKLPISDLI